MDPRVTRRSARLQEAQRPSYPQVQTSSQSQTQTQSPFNSSSSLASMSSVDTNSSQSPVMMQQSFRPDSAPLPSPSQSRMEQSNPFDFFNPSAQQPQQMQMQSQQMFPSMEQRNNQHYNPAARGSPETESFLSNLNLVAEAAKRAQMACLMRDFGDCEL